MYEIMIVDDDVQMLDMVELVLRREGFTVKRAASGAEALAAVCEETPDLFLIDSMMPEMDGVTLCRRLRVQSHTANTPIIFLTGNTSSNNVVDAFNSGGDDFIRKPFVPRELIARVRAHIRRSALYSEENLPVIRILSAQYRLYVDEKEITLTRVEFDLLKFMCSAPHKLHSTEELLAGVWKYPKGWVMQR